MVRDLRRVEVALGDGTKSMYPSEAEPATKMAKKLVAATDLPGRAHAPRGGHRGEVARRRPAAVRARPPRRADAAPSGLRADADARVRAAGGAGCPRSRSRRAAHALTAERPARGRRRGRHRCAREARPGLDRGARGRRRHRGRHRRARRRRGGAAGLRRARGRRRHRPRIARRRARATGRRRTMRRPSWSTTPASTSRRTPPRARIGSRTCRSTTSVETLDVNLAGTFNAIQVFGAPMRDAGRGSIVNIGSLYASIAPEPALLRPHRSRPAVPQAARLRRLEGRRGQPHALLRAALGPARRPRQRAFAGRRRRRTGRRVPAQVHAPACRCGRMAEPDGPDRLRCCSSRPTRRAT